MKKILVLTDLSENDFNLTQTAVMFAKKLQADILLFNNYQIIPVTTFYGGGPWVGEDETRWEQESRTELNKMAVKLHQSIHLMLPGEKWRPEVSVECLEGSLVDNVNHIIAHHDIELILMGGGKDSRFEHMLFGNNTKSIIADVTRPILIVPSGVELNDIDKVFFATDYNSADIKAVSYLAHLGELLCFDLEIIHVEVLGDMDNSETQRKKEFLTLLEDLSYPSLQHTEVRGKEVVSRLITLCRDKQASILGLLHQQDSLLVRMIRHSTTVGLLEKQAIPLMVFPSRMS
jgi:nucleotide-binding universal stress UspA family protein